MKHDLHKKTIEADARALVERYGHRALSEAKRQLDLACKRSDLHGRFELGRVIQYLEENLLEGEDMMFGDHKRFQVKACDFGGYEVTDAHSLDAAGNPRTICYADTQEEAIEEALAFEEHEEEILTVLVNLRGMPAEHQAQIRILADGFGDLAGHPERDTLMWDWSHVRDSSPMAFQAMAQKMAEIK